MQNARVMELLASGLDPKQVMSITGISSAYLAVLIKDEEFAALLAEAKLAHAVSADEGKVVDNKYLALEHNIMNRMESQLPYAELRDLTNALRVVTDRADKVASRKAALEKGNEKTVVHVHLTLPRHTMPEHTINASNEVVAIADRALNPMQSTGVQNLFKALSVQDAEEVKAVA